MFCMNMAICMGKSIVKPLIVLNFWFLGSHQVGSHFICHWFPSHVPLGISFIFLGLYYIIFKDYWVRGLYPFMWSVKQIFVLIRTNFWPSIEKLVYCYDELLIFIFGTNYSCILQLQDAHDMCDESKINK